MPSFLTSFKTIIHNRYLVGVWVWKDLHGRYVGSAGGWLWALIFPAAMMATYFFIFSFFLKIRVPYAPGPTGYFVFLMSALLPWGATAEALSRSTTVFREQAILVQKVAFPLEVLPAYIIVVAFFQPLIGMLLFTVAVSLIKGISVTVVVFLPVVIVVQVFFNLGLVLGLSAIAVLFRDLTQGIGVLLQIWFFASPILYPISMVPDALQWFTLVNPLAMLALIYQNLFLQGQLLIRELVMFSIWALCLWWLGSTVFNRLRHVMPDLV
jgi:lipopolysaccharide transport system permease protein